MGDALRRLFLAIGIALGLASGQSDPSLVSRLSVQDGMLVVGARVENPFAPAALELVEAGTRVALRFSIQAESSSRGEIRAEQTRVLWYDLRSGRYRVDFEGGRSAALIDPQAARSLASELPRLALCRPEELPLGSRVIVRAEIGLIDSRGAWHGAPVLWNYYGPRAVIGYDGLR